MGNCKSKNSKNLQKEKISSEKNLSQEKQKLDEQIDENEKKLTELETKISSKTQEALEAKKANKVDKAKRLLVEIKKLKLNQEKITGVQGMLKTRQEKLEDLQINNDMAKLTKNNTEIIKNNLDKQEGHLNVLKKNQEINTIIQENQNEINDVVLKTKDFDEEDLEDEFNLLGQSEVLEELNKYDIDQKNYQNHNLVQTNKVKAKNLA